MASVKMFSGEVELMDLDDIAKKLNVSIETIRRYVRKGKLKAQKIGKRYMVSRDNFIAFANAETSGNKA